MCEYQYAKPTRSQRLLDNEFKETNGKKSIEHHEKRKMSKLPRHTQTARAAVPVQAGGAQKVDKSKFCVITRIRIHKIAKWMQ